MRQLISGQVAAEGAVPLKTIKRLKTIQIIQPIRGVTEAGGESQPRKRIWNSGGNAAQASENKHWYTETGRQFAR
jgi:hypothetical protein